MSSTWGADYAKEHANDGINNTYSLQEPRSCVHSHPEVNPWWAVDLGAALAVVGVLFTNRAENHGNVLIPRAVSIRYI